MSNRPTRLVLITNNAERAATVERIAADNGWQLLPCVQRPVPIELLDHLRIDIFLVDLDLDNAFEQIGELVRRPGAKVIALASAEQMGNWSAVLQMGVKELVPVPIAPQHLVMIVSQFVNSNGNGMLGQVATSRPTQPATPPLTKNMLPPGFSTGEPQNNTYLNPPALQAPTQRPVQGPLNVAPRKQFAEVGQSSSNNGFPMAQQSYSPVPVVPQTNMPAVQPGHYPTPSQFPGIGSTNGYPTNGHSPNGHLANGYGNGAVPNGYTPNGYAQNNYVANAYVANGQYATATRMIAITGLRGGVGRSTIAANLAIALKQRANANVVLAEAHHGMGHLALLLNMMPRHTLASLTDGDALDLDIMRSVLQQHSSGVQLLSAPLDVSQLVEFGPDTWRMILSLLKQTASYIVVDTSAYADSVLSEVLTAADDIVVVCGPDILSMRSTMSLLETLRSERDTVHGRVHLVLNRAGVRGGLDISTLQKQLHEKFSVSLTDDAALATYSLNRGVPFVLSHGRASVTRSIQSLVDQFYVPANVPATTAKRPFALLPLLNRG